MRIVDPEFFSLPADRLASALLGKCLVRQTDLGISRFLIAETECYMGVEDTACHAARKKPLGAVALWHKGGTAYVYLIYGMYYMLNVVAGKEGDPMAVLIRGGKEIVSGKEIVGPGRLARALEIDKSFNKEDLLDSKRLWIEETGLNPLHITGPRVGIDYASPCDRLKPWRFLAYEYL